MPIRALTIDFWNTMVVARTGGAARQAQRLTQITHTAQRVRPATSQEEVREALAVAAARHDTHWREEHRTPSTDTLIGFVWQALDVEVDPAHHQATVRAVEEGLLHGAPDFAEGLTDALAWAADRYPLAIISDTMFSPGRVIRQLLDQRGTLKAFSAFVFSDEVGFSKPDRRAFDQAAAALEVRPDEVLHIGDLRRTDIAGARGAGALGALYTGIHTDDGHPAQPHVHLASWADLPQTLAQLDG